MWAVATAPVGSLHRISGVASPISAAVATSPVGSFERISAAGCLISSSPFLRLGCRHRSPRGDSTACWHPCDELIPLDQFSSRVRNRSRDHGHTIFTVHVRFGFSGAGFEFGSTSGRRYNVSPRAAAAAAAAAEAAGSDFGSFGRKWTDAVEGSGVKDFLAEILKNFEFQKRRRVHWAPWLAAAIVAMTLAGILTYRSTIISLHRAILGAAVFFLFGLLVDIGKLRLIRESCQHSYAKASEQLQIFCRETSQVAHDSFKLAETVFSPGRSVLMGLIAPDRIENSISKDLVEDYNPDVEAVVTNISQSVAQLMSIVAATEVSDVHCLSTGKPGMQALCRELQSVEAALLAAQSLFDSKLNYDAVETPVSGRTSGVLGTNCGGAEKLVEYEDLDQQEKESIRDCDHSKADEPQLVQQTSNQPLAVKFMPAPIAPPFQQDRILSSPHLGRESFHWGREKETLTFSPLVSKTDSVPVTTSYDGDTFQAGDGFRVGESIPTEALERGVVERSIREAVSGLEKSSSLGDVDHLVEFHKLSPVRNFLVEEQSPHSVHSSTNQHKELILFPETKSSYPDPWLDDLTAQPIDQRVIAGGDCEVRLSHVWRNDNESQLVDVVLIADELSKAESFCRHGTGNGKGVNGNGTVDFWGKNAGSITKTTEQRGTLTKRQATGRGSNFGSDDDLEDDWSQERGKRIASEEDRRQVYSRDLSRSNSSGRPWPGEQQPGASGRGGLRDDEQRWRDNDSAAADADYAQGEANVRGQQILRRDRDLDVRKDGLLLDKDRPMDERVSQPRDILDARVDLVYPDSVGSRFSPQKRPSNSNSSVVASKSVAGEESSAVWTNDETGFTRREGRDVNEGNYVGSNRPRDMPPNPDGKVYRRAEDGLKDERSALEYSAYSPEASERKLALQKYQQSQSVQFERYLDEAEALLEEGMQGLEGRIEVGVAERMLYEAAKLFEIASDMDPADLIAIGQWGNTLLVHGELKLRVSQQIRNILPSRKVLPSPKPEFPFSRREGESADREREVMELSLQEVCEECEELLVDAGRKFRRALSLDRSDGRALYNWGLALCYRGQLIAEEGGERAMQDADKVYLAAIDKFEAMLGISKDYTAGGTAALLNWGIAIRDRSRLRAMVDKERVQLLLQARELFQDAVRLDPNYGQARGAVAACTAELKELQGYEALQKEDVNEKPPRSWWKGGG